jgi:hypothetical protein
MDVVTRDQWDARPPTGRVALIASRLRGIGVHYSASDADGDHARCASRVRGIQDFHLDGRGWYDIAYSFLTCRHGTVYEGRGWGTRTAANGTDAANDAYHAVCFLGADRDGRDDVLPAGRRALADLIAEGHRRYPTAWEVRPHSDFKATACPGEELRCWLRAGMPIDAAGERPADMPTDLLVVNSKPAAVATSPVGGYWIATEDGGVFTYGGAGFYGSMGATTLNAPVVDMAATPTGAGYWLFAADGGVFPFGDAPFHGSLGGAALNAPVVDSAATVTGGGYLMLGGDGGIFTFGDADYGGRVEWKG